MHRYKERSWLLSTKWTRTVVNARQTKNRYWRRFSQSGRHEIDKGLLWMLKCGSPADNQGIFQTIFTSSHARLGEFPSLYLLVYEAINWIPSHAMDWQNHNWCLTWLPLSSCSCSWGQTVTRLTEKRRKTTTKPVFQVRAALNHATSRLRKPAPILNLNSALPAKSLPRHRKEWLRV